MQKKALLVGINEYESISDLRGCLNDVSYIRHVLVSMFGALQRGIVFSTLACFSTINTRRRGDET